jgi:AAHS family 4-hydroxybenzoate transporter-like MFS transporter
MAATKQILSNPAIKSPSELIDNSPMGGQQILIIALCMLFNMLDGFDITAMAIVAKTVGQELALPAERLGWIFSFALAGMMAGAMFLAPLSDLIGRRKVIIISLFLVSVSIIFTAQAESLSEFIVLRFISGLGAGSLLASQATLASEYSPDRFRALAVGAVTAGYPMGAMMTSVVAAYVMPEYGWRGMFWFGGIATLFMVFLAICLIPESLKYLVNRRSQGALEKVNKQLKRIGKPSVETLPELVEQDTLNNQRGFLGNVLMLLNPDYRRITILLWLTFFFSFATLYVMLSWIPQMVEDSGYTFTVGRDAFFLFNLGGVIGIFIMGILATRVWLSNLLLTMLFGAAIGMVVFASVTVEQSVMMTIIFIIGVLLQGGFAGLYAAASKAYATQVRATGLGWCLGLGRSGAVIGPTLAGYLIAAQFDMSAIFYIFAAPMAIAGMIGFYLKLK